MSGTSIALIIVIKFHKIWIRHVFNQITFNFIYFKSTPDANHDASQWCDHSLSYSSVTCCNLYYLLSTEEATIIIPPKSTFETLVDPHWSKTQFCSNVQVHPLNPCKSSLHFPTSNLKIYELLTIHWEPRVVSMSLDINHFHPQMCATT